MSVRIAFALAMLAGSLVNAQSGSLLLINAKIWTVDPSHPEADAIAVQGNRIAAVGSTQEILKLKTPKTKVIDLHGRRLLPGFNDAHVHFYSGGANLTGPQLRSAESEIEFRNALADYARHVPKGEWITGGNW